MEIQRRVIAHAQSDMAANPAASHENKKKPRSLLGRAFDKRNEWASRQPSFGGQFAAMFREAVKDIRQTINEIYFGKGEHMAEAGTPLNPTAQQITVQQGNFRGYVKPLQRKVHQPAQAPDTPENSLEDAIRNLQDPGVTPDDPGRTR